MEILVHDFNMQNVWSKINTFVLLIKKYVCKIYLKQSRPKNNKLSEFWGIW